jgi:hypothetical protein
VWGLTVCRAEAPGCRDHRKWGTRVKWADIVHVGVDVGMWWVKGWLGPHGGVPVGRDPDEGDVGERRTAGQRRRPTQTNGEKKIEEISTYCMYSWSKIRFISWQNHYILKVLPLNSRYCNSFIVSKIICLTRLVKQYLSIPQQELWTIPTHSTSQKFGHTYSFKGFSLFVLFSTL